MTEQIYTDKEILADALTAEKAATNNYNAFANECVHDSVRDAILHCLPQPFLGPVGWRPDDRLCQRHGHG